MTAAKPDTSLEDIRREIDAIDDGILELLQRRFAASARVRATKKTEGSLTSSPLRPAREAAMLRRLIAGSGTGLSPQLLVRLWRVILSASTQSQAAITIHIDCTLAASVENRVRLAEHFCGMPVEAHTDVHSVLTAVQSRTGDIAVLDVNAPWADWLATDPSPSVRAIGSLPVVQDGAMPSLLVFGHAEAHPSGHDETLVLSRAALNATPAPQRWHIRSGEWHVTSLSGFLSTDDLAPAGSDLLVAGRCPTSIEVSSS